MGIKFPLLCFQNNYLVKLGDVAVSSHNAAIIRRGHTLIRSESSSIISMKSKTYLVLFYVVQKHKCIKSFLECRKNGEKPSRDFDQPFQVLFTWAVLMIRQDMAKLFWAEGKVRIITGWLLDWTTVLDFFCSVSIKLINRTLNVMSCSHRNVCLLTNWKLLHAKK